MRTRHLPLAVAILPILTIGFSYAVSIIEQTVPACFPFIDGCTSISRAARNGNAIFVFRPGMMFTAALLMAYWLLSYHWFLRFDKNNHISKRAMLIIGITGAVFLVLYTDFLGSNGPQYRWMRHKGVIFFFAFTLLAQFIHLRNLNLVYRNHADVPFRRKIHITQYLVCGLILVLGLTSVILKALELDSDESENVLEWNVTLLLCAYFMSSYFQWRDTEFRLLPSVNQSPTKNQ